MFTIKRVDDGSDWSALSRRVYHQSTRSPLPFVVQHAKCNPEICVEETKPEMPSAPLTSEYMEGFLQHMERNELSRRKHALKHRQSILKKYFLMVEPTGFLLKYVYGIQGYIFCTASAYHTKMSSRQPFREDSDTADTDGRLSSECSPLPQRRGGILKGGRLWKSLDTDKDINEQNDDQRSTTTASDEDGSITPRSVRFLERPKDSEEDHPKKEPETVHTQTENSEMTTQQKEYNSTSGTHRLETPLILTINAPKANSAVQQLFNSGRPPPPAIEPQLVTSETLRAWDAGVRPKTEEAAVRRVAERNALRCSLLRSEARKKQQPKIRGNFNMRE
ncbi:hypothetical protein HW555_005259 [Spodoptera exigua]|uniref:Uncharacterized protein n=1 Tax=Spodoptera exigua TaxID=7107 RepID=A0A835L4P0_SPOEX|nr:hypothetical protein HW555_005259 [Spodoptera exigua]